MKRLFRSILDIKKAGVSTIAQSDLKKNYRAFLASRVEPEDPSFIKLYHWIEAHYRQYDELPDIMLLEQRGRLDGEEPVLASLRDIVLEQPFIDSNYQAILKEKFEEQSKSKFQKVVTETWQIASSGLKIKKKDLKGLNQAIQYFVGESRSFRMGDLNVKTESQIRSVDDAREINQEYAKKKKDPLSSIGMYTFLDKIDDSCRGIKPGNLVMVAGFVGQAKSTLSANLVYNGIMQGMNGLFIPLEMNFNEMRDFMYCLHTTYPGWMSHPKYRNLVGKISYDKIRYGELSDMEEEFFTASNLDFSSNDFGKLCIYQPSEPLTPAGLEMKCQDFNATLQEEGRSLDFLVVDYVGLMVPDRNDRYGDYNIDLNGIIKRLKIFSVNFNEGKGLRTITPFQINREGWKDAQKNDGVFKLSALSNANESERSCDLIMTVYMTDEMKRQGMVKIGCLKHRHGAEFPPFEAQINFSNKRIQDLIVKRTETERDPTIMDLPLVTQ